MGHFLSVFIGGGIGATTRYVFSFLIPQENVYLPFYTLTVNFLGCFLAGIFFTVLVTKANFNPCVKTFLITGFCGGLSTFSAFSLEILEYINAGNYVKAGLYSFISLLICIISVILGVVLVKKYV